MTTKAHTIGTAEFRAALNTVCDLIPSIRFYSREIVRIEQSPKGVEFYDADGKRVAAVSSETLKERAPIGFYKEGSL